MNAGRSLRRLGLMVAVLVASVVLISCGDDGSGDGSLSLAGVVRTPALDVSTVTLPNASDPATPVTMKADAGGLMLVYFGYTSCPDICPTTMSDMSVAMGDLSDERAERVSVAMVTVDPDRDSGEVLDAYLGHFFERTVSLRTEDPAELLDATNAFGVQFEVADHQAGDDAYEVSHTAVTYVVDDTGTVVVEWPFGFESADMTADLNAIFDRADAA